VVFEIATALLVRPISAPSAHRFGHRVAVVERGPIAGAALTVNSLAITTPEGRFSRPIPPPLTLCVSVLPFGLIGREGLMGMVGVDKIGEIRRAYFEQTARSRRSCARFGVARDGAQGHPQPQDGVQVRAGVQPTPSLVTGRGSDGDS